jgi:Transposase DDE domain/Transposase domain (DUF772)
MLGTSSPQHELFDVGNVWPLALDPVSFYGQLACVSHRLFSDEQFARFYSDKMGRPSVPPSQLALVLILQQYEHLSDESAVEHTAYDLRWAAVMRREAGEPLCAKSTLQLFRAHLILHEEVGAIFKASIDEARRAGLLGSKKLRIAVDTKPILGRGAVEDTFNLLSHSLRMAIGTLASEAKMSRERYQRRHDLERYGAPSIKGTETLDWSDKAATREFLSGIVADAVRVLRLAQASQDSHVKKSAVLLEKLLLQDVEVVDTPDGPKAGLIAGTTPGRIPSVTDPEQRHGRKSASKRFTGSKASVATDVTSGIILAADVLAGDAADATNVLALVQSAEENAGTAILETLADCAYGSGPTRQEFADAGRELVAKVPTVVGRDGKYPKNAFRIDLAVGSVTCPTGVTTREFREDRTGTKVYSFGSACSGCALREQCTSAAQGRTVQVHPQEALLAKARAFQESDVGRAKLKERLAVENSLARLGWLGIGQARYIGHKKTRFQLLLCATVANLRRTWNYAGANAGNGAVAAA